MARGQLRPSIIWSSVTLMMVLVAAAYYPGVMLTDSISQYNQAVTAQYTDWHPPVMAWLWAQIDWWGAGPAPMFLFDLLLYGLGIGLIADGLRISGRTDAALLVLLSGFAPISLGYIGVILKDSTLAVVLLAAFGVVSRFALCRRRVPAWANLFTALLIAFAALLRFNAPFATVPVIIYMIPKVRQWSRSCQLAFGAFLLIASLVLTQAASNAIFQPQRSDVHLSLIVYDLGGISYYAGRDYFPDLGIPDFVDMNRESCYSKQWWDTYFWINCKFVFEHFRKVIRDNHTNPFMLWMQAVISEPLAYLRHRISHVNHNMRFLLPYAMRDVTFIESPPNRYNFEFHPNALTLAIREAGLLQASTPVGWPITWLALALGWLLLAPALQPGPSRMLLVMLALSALSYGAGYFVFSLASDLRYHLWTMIGAAVATAIGTAEMVRAERLPRTRITIAAAPVIAVVIAGLSWRILHLPAI